MFIHSLSLPFSNHAKPLTVNISLISFHTGLPIRVFDFTEMQSLSRKIFTCSTLFPSWTSMLWSLLDSCFASALFSIRALILLTPRSRSIPDACAGVIPFGNPVCGLQKLWCILCASANSWADVSLPNPLLVFRSDIFLLVCLQTHLVLILFWHGPFS